MAMFAAHDPLVHPVEQGWECSGWLDWEYAWVGDPDWDLVRMDLFRTKPIGPTPSAFYEGYGAVPADLPRQVYALHIHLWMANDFLNGGSILPPTYEAAMGVPDPDRRRTRGARQSSLE
jgi:hypothetical protein